MTAPRLGNPVIGLIQPRSATWDGRSFIVTSTFAEHVASGRGPGVDLGNGRCGDPILAVAAGIVAEVYQDPAGPWIVRYDLPEYPGYQAAIAHMPGPEVTRGAALIRGQTIGHVGKSGASACHLHAGMKLNGVEIDSWPLLEQNQPALPPPPPVTTYPRTLNFAAGTYVGRRFSATGAIVASKSYALARASSAPTSLRSLIKNQTGYWFYITAGVWAGYWIREGAGIT